MNDHNLGILLIASAIIGIGLYSWLIFLVNPILTLQSTGFVAITGLLGFTAWIGYTMARMSPPDPLEFND
jgi:predicted DNA-binding transcriptional regulator